MPFLGFDIITLEEAIEYSDRFDEQKGELEFIISPDVKEEILVLLNEMEINYSVEENN